MIIIKFIKFWVGWLLGIAFSLIALINIFWGNDSIYGIFILCLALLFFPPVDGMIRHKTNVGLPTWSKIAIAFFIIWSSIGVGELFDKIHKMIASFQ